MPWVVGYLRRRASPGGDQGVPVSLVFSHLLLLQSVVRQIHLQNEEKSAGVDSELSCTGFAGELPPVI